MSDSYHLKICTNVTFNHGALALVGQGLLIVEHSLSHSDTPHSVGLLWTSDQPDAETYDNTQHSQQTDIHASGRIRTYNPSKRATADPRRRPRGQWNRQFNFKVGLN
jgi:GH43 family beta-xylosidase